MDQVDEDVDHESDFSSETEDDDDDEGSESSCDCDDDGEEEEEEDTEDDGYSDDDSFVTSTSEYDDDDHDDGEEEEEEKGDGVMAKGSARGVPGAGAASPRPPELVRCDAGIPVLDDAPPPVEDGAASGAG